MILHQSRWPAAVLAGLTCFCVFYAPKQCSAAATEALQLCGGTLLVGIFPFLIVSNLIAGSGTAPILAAPLRPLARLLGCKSAAGASVLLLGLAGGFAPAAAADASLYRQGELTGQEAARLLAASAAAGPSFVILSVGQNLLHSTALGVKLYLSQIFAGYLSVFIIGRLEFFSKAPSRQQTPSHPAALTPFSLSGAIADAAGSYLRLCGFVLYFRCLCAGVAALVPWLEPYAAMLLEVSSGCQFAAALPGIGLFHVHISNWLHYAMTGSSMPIVPSFLR